jgi:hypothetical protein
LDKVLRRVRLLDQERRVWADQICIDQNNVEERGHQVGLMAHIYRLTEKTLIWLGGDEHSGSDVTGLVHEVNERIDDQLSDCSSWNDLQPANPDDQFFQDKRWASLDELFASSWFTRVWVIQEVGIGGNPWVLFGDSEFDWTSLMRLQQWRIDYASFLIPPDSIPVHGVHTGTVYDWGVEKSPQQMKQDFGAISKKGSFIKTLNNAKGLNATDPRDFVYSFLGHPSAFLPTAGRTIVEPNYKLAPMIVYKDCAVAWLREKKDLSILYAVEHANETISPEVPSWVPIWNISVAKQTLGLQVMLPFNSSAGMETWNPKVVNESQLHLRGLLFDTIVYVSGALDRSALQLPKSSQTQSEIVHFWNYIREVGANEEYAAPTTPLMVFIATLTAERYTGNHAQFKADRYAYCVRLLELSGHSKIGQITVEPDGDKIGNISTFVDLASYFCNGRRLIYTKHGRYGFAPKASRTGDVCAVISGCKIPMILRPLGSLGYYQLVGEAYIRGVMEGELAQKEGQSNDCKLADLVLL